MSPSPNLKWKAKNMTLKRLTFICLSAHNASAMVEIILMNPQKAYRNSLKHWNFISFTAKLIIYKYTCRSQVLRREKIFVYVHFNTFINSHLFKTVKKWWNLESHVADYIFAYNKLCLILNYLCSTAHNFTLRSLALQPTGTVLGAGMLISNHRVSSG